MNRRRAWIAAQLLFVVALVLFLGRRQPRSLLARPLDERTLDHEWLSDAR